MFEKVCAIISDIVLIDTCISVLEHVVSATVWIITNASVSLVEELYI